MEWNGEVELLSGVEEKSPEVRFYNKYIFKEEICQQYFSQIWPVE